MRYRFAREGVKTEGSKCYFENGSIKWDAEKNYPVHLNNEFLGPIGIATDIQLAEDGWLTAEIEWREGTDSVIEELGETVHLTIQVYKLEEDIDHKEWRVIHSCSLMSIFLTTEPDPWKVEDPLVFCPECASGKLVNCVDYAPHPVTDIFVRCQTTVS